MNELNIIEALRALKQVRNLISFYNSRIKKPMKRNDFILMGEYLRILSYYREKQKYTRDLIKYNYER